MAKDKTKKKADGTVGTKEGKEKTKHKKTEDAESRGDDAKKSKSSKLKDSAQAPEVSTPRLSRSSFEVGALRASPGPMTAQTLGESTSSAGVAAGAYLGMGGVAQKKRSILGLGLPPTIRLPTVRSGSTASSVLVGGASTVGLSFSATPTSAAANAAAAFSVGKNNNNNATNDNRLSVDSALNLINPSTIPRPSSVLSNASSAGSSLHPISTTSTDLRRSRASSGASSVKWDEERLETMRERRGKEAAGAATEYKEKDGSDKRTSRESKHLLEGRKRGSLASLFPDSRRGWYTSSEGGGPGSGEERNGGRRVGGYPIVTIEEATVDGHGFGCV